MKRFYNLTAGAFAIAALLLAVAAGAAAAAPGLDVTMLTPDYVTPGNGMVMFVSVLNTSNAPLSGDMTIRYTFPAGVGVADPDGGIRPGFPDATCTQSGQVDECVVDATGLPPGGQLRFKTATTVDPSATGSLAGSVEVSGGGVPDDVTTPWTAIAGPIGPFAIKAFGLGMTDGAGPPATQAGADPGELSTDIEFLTQAAENFNFVPGEGFLVTAPPESIKDVTVHVPPGFVGNPTSTPVRCTPAQLTTPVPNTVIPQCPPESQIGVVQLNSQDIVPLYNVQPPRGSPAEFGFFYQSIVVTLLAKLRPLDNGIDIVTHQTPNSIPIDKIKVTMWGVPGDSSHDRFRGVCLQNGQGNNGNNCPLADPTREAFLREPTSCTGDPLGWGLDITTYQHPDADTPFSASTSTPGVNNCSLVPFGPSFSLTPSVSTPNAPTGLSTTLTIPQDNGPDGVAQADLRTAMVTLPAGLTINPSSADGLKACTDGELKLRQDGTATCPLESKIGTVTINTPLLDHPLGGSVWLRTQNSDDPLSGEMFRIAIEIRSDNDGIDIKLPGAVRPDPNNGGQLTATFDALPQLPFSDMTLTFKDGPRAPLVSPSTCGDNLATVSLTPWSVPSAVISQPGFATNGCGAPAFSPGFEAGVVNPVAGKSSPFNVKLTRGDGDQQFKGLTVYTPAGLLGRIASVIPCSNADANAGTCPGGSLIGTATVGAGAGSDPFYVTNGQVFLTKSYNHAPYGLSIVVHAVAGPFDLGTVVVRAAINVDSRTSALTVVSDPFPTILKGVPLNIRDVRISINKPNFMVNPTSCTTKSVAATATSVNGWNRGLSSRFQVGECASLKFAPTMSMTVGSRGHTHPSNSTPLTTVLTQTAGQSNLREVKVSLPTTLDALLPVVNRACTLAQYNANNCKRAEVGSAVAVTPLLRDPLRGGAFFVRHPGRPLPDLMVALRGAVSLDLVGKVTIPHGTHLATDFAVPDAPVSRFTLKINSGANGPIGVVTNLCTKKARNATVAILMKGQNGASITRNQRLHINGCGASAARKRR